MKMTPGHIEDLMSQVKTKYKVKKFTNYQYRINDVVDIYPVNRKYHILKTNKRGTYNDLYMFLDDMFKPKILNVKPQIINLPNQNFDIGFIQSVKIGIGIAYGMSLFKLLELFTELITN